MTSMVIIETKTNETFQQNLQRFCFYNDLTSNHFEDFTKWIDFLGF